MQQHSIFH